MSQDHPTKPEKISDIVKKITYDYENRSVIFLDLPLGKRSTVFLRLSKNIQKQILASIPNEEIVDIIEHLDPDRATDLIQLLNNSRQKKIVKLLGSEMQRTLEFLIQFDPKTAAGIMNLDYIQVESIETISQTAEKFREHEKRTGRPAEILVLEEGKLTGYLPGYQLGLAKSSAKIKDFTRKISKIKFNATSDQVMSLFRNHPHAKVAVINEKGSVIGIIYSDDILNLLNQNKGSSLYSFAGVQEEESATDPAIKKVNYRYKWLIINLGTSFLAAFTVGLFNETISKYVLLAVYMPIVAGMGGNAATQTLAVMVRGLSQKEIDFKNAWPTLKNELEAGLINGLVNGLIVAVIVLVFNRDTKVAFILAMAMIVNLLVAAVFGTIVPLIMKKLGKDPATSATIFITTATDVLGFLAFLGLATLLLK